METKIDWQRVGSFVAGHIQQHAATEDGCDRIHRKPVHPRGVRLHRSRHRAVVQVAATGKVT